MYKESKKEEVIFKAAIKLNSATERAVYIREACGDDTELLVRVAALLKAHYESGDFLEPKVTLDSSPTREGPGTKIGHYELLELIGEGGMAQQSVLESQVTSENTITRDQSVSANLIFQYI